MQYHTNANRKPWQFVSLVSICALFPVITQADSRENTAAQLTINAAQRAASGSTDVKDILVDAANIATRKTIAAAKQKAQEENIHDWLMRTDVSINLTKEGKPSYSIETINPIHQNERNTTFWQGRLASKSGDQTLNLGLGFRRLNKNKTWLFGVNTFIDQTREHKHRRLGVGLEAFGPYTTVRYNNYNARSDEKLVSNNAGVKTLELAQSGWDLGVEAPVPYVDWAKFDLKHYQWDGVNQDDTKGQSLAVRMFPTDNLEIEVGAQNDNTDNTRGFANLTWYFDKPAHAPRHGKKRQVFARRDVTQHRLEKVRRHNDIVVETRTTGSVALTIGRGT